MISSIIGLPVVSMDTGLKLGNIKDVLIDADGLQATTFLISGDSGRGGLPFAKILAIGPDVITVASAEPIFWASATDPGPGRESNEIKGLPVVNISGEVLGTVHDITLHGNRLKSLEVRAGGVFGIGSTDTEIPIKAVRSIGPKLVTVDVPMPKAPA